MDKEIQLLAPENLPLDLGELGIVTEAELVMPSVYEIALQQQETNFAVQAFIVIKSTSNFSDTVIQYGQAIPDYLDFLLYTENSTGNPCVIISYELCRYKILHHLPLSENESIREIAAFGAEQYPDYFGHYPVPTLTPWGCTTRHKTITNGLFWLETEQCQRGLAIACPRYDDLSDGARGLAEKFDDGFALPGQQDPGNIFFTESNSSVPLFELLSGIPEEQIVCPINRIALMNAIYQYHPEYAAMYNSAEQAGLNDAFGLLMNILGIQTELHGDMDRVIRLFPHSGIEFIAF